MGDEPWKGKWHEGGRLRQGSLGRQAHGIDPSGHEGAERVGLLVLTERDTKACPGQEGSRGKRPLGAQYRGRKCEVFKRMGWRIKVKKVFMER